MSITQPPYQEEADSRHVHASMLNAESSSAGLQLLAQRIDAGEIEPFVGRTYPLVDVARGWRAIQTEYGVGRIVFTVGSEPRRERAELPSAVVAQRGATTTVAS